MRVDYSLIPALHAAARRHRSQVIGALIAAAFDRIVKMRSHPGSAHVQGRPA
jgi:hypothetical protein